MNEHAPYQPSPETIARGYEGSPINPRYFLYALIGFIIFAVILSLILLATMHGFSAMEEKADDSRRLPWASTTQPAPPQPWLQPSVAQGSEPRQPWQDMAAFREHEDQVLDSYGPVDSSTGTAKIPIDRAMHILAERGLPTSRPTGGGR